ncbi:MAG TPA: hypothetical protein PKX15_00365 [Bacteroidales bacterium]|nr:hypothetical protein [Bacteroidales bacterium]
MNKETDKVNSNDARYYYNIWEDSLEPLGTIGPFTSWEAMVERLRNDIETYKRNDFDLYEWIKIVPGEKPKIGTFSRKDLGF